MKKSTIKRRAGFTLAEAIIAIAVLALFAAAVVPLTTVVFSTKIAMVEVNKCQMLASTVLLTVADEIRYGQNPRVEEDRIVVDSVNFGYDTAFVLKDGKICAQAPDGTCYDLMTDKYYGTLHVSEFVVEQATSAEASDKTKQQITIKITVCGSSDAQYSAEITVAALNGVQNSH